MRNMVVISSFVLIELCLSCEKKSLPVVETITYEILSPYEVILTGEVTDEAGSPVMKRGFCWATHPDPMIADHYSDNQFNMGVFLEKATTLEYGKEYFFRSYAVNATGTGFGKVLSFRFEITAVLGNVTDSRDGKTYKTVVIGTQTWMAENLAYLPSVSPDSSGSLTDPIYYVYSYQGTDVGDARAHPNYTRYGVLYNWPAALAGKAYSSRTPSGVQGPCPDGWHLPSNAEWNILRGSLGPMNGKELQSTIGWLDNGGGYNSSGFNAYPGGCRSSSSWDSGGGIFSGEGTFSGLWTTSAAWNNDATIRGLHQNHDVLTSGQEKHDGGYSIRCVRD